MTSLFAVREAIIERLAPVRDVTYYWYMPDQVESPAVVVLPDFPFVDFEQTFGAEYAAWNLMLTLVVDRIDEEAAQELLSEWIDPAGPFVGALRGDDVDDALARLSSDVRVTTGGSYSEMTMSRTGFYYAQLRVQVKA